jgi:hypothetical protein
MLPLMRSILVALALLLLTACAPLLPGKLVLVGNNATLQSGTSVAILDAWVREREVMVKLWVTNLGSDVMFVNRDGFAMRLSDGRIVPRQGAVHHVYTLMPGGGHEVYVKFVDPMTDLRLYKGFSLVVGGISFASDPRERVVGEIPMLPNGEHP